LKFIENESNYNAALGLESRFLIHCQKGHSRSVAIALAYLMAHNNYTLSGALDYIIRLNEEVCPNIGFI
jgi:protein-tyrosine phosphatase